MENVPPPIAAQQVDEVSLLAALASERAHAEDPSPLRATPFGKYTLQRSLGRGGFGEVFLATEDSTWKKVAIKILANRRRADAAARTRFELEIKIGRHLRHPHILPVIDDGEVNGLRYFAAPFVDGEDLLHRIAKKPLDVRVAVETIRKVAEAVAEAHRQGVLHRDLKPANILIEANTGKPYVADFGLAKQFHTGTPQTETLAVLGTQPYMPPEQADPNLGDFSPATDVYALGASLYQALTGRTPFPRPDRQHRDILHQIAWDRPLPPSALNSQIPAQLDRLCMICLEKHPYDRYESAKELAEDLSRFAEGKPIVARSPSTATRVLRRCGRQPLLTASVLTLLVVSVMGGTVAWYFAQEAARSSTELANVAPKLKEAETKTATAESERSNAQAAAAETARSKALQAYATDMREVATAWAAGDVVRVADLLERNTPREGGADLRGVEWYYWDQQLQTTCLRFHEEGEFRGLALSQRGSLMAAATYDRLTVWDLERRQRRFQKQLGPGSLKRFDYLITGVADQAAAISPDGELVAATCPGRGGGSLYVWDKEGNERLADSDDGELSGHAVAFSPDGLYVVASGIGGRVKSWDVRTMKPGSPPLAELFQANHANPEFGPTVVLWFVGSHEVHAFTHDAKFDFFPWTWGDDTYAYRRLGSESGPRPVLTITPDLQVVTPTERLMGPRHSSATFSRPLDQRYKSFAVARCDDQVIAGCTDNVVRTWRIPEDESTRVWDPDEFKGARANIECVTRGGGRTAAACSDATVCVWPGEMPDQSRPPSEPATIANPVYQSPSGKWRIARDGPTATLKDPSGSDAVTFAVRDFPLDRVVWSPDESLVAVYCSNQGQGLNFAHIDRSAQSRVTILNTTARQEIASLPSADGGDVMDIAFSPDNRWLCVGTKTHGTAVYSTKDGSRAAQLDPAGWCVGFSASGRMVGVADDTGTGVWSIDRGEWIWRKAEGATAVAFDPTERSFLYAAWGDVRHLRRVDLSTGVASDIPMSAALLRTATLSSDGTRVFANDGSRVQVFLSNSADGEPILSTEWKGLPTDPAALAKALDDKLKQWAVEWRNSHDK